MVTSDAYQSFLPLVIVHKLVWAIEGVKNLHIVIRETNVGESRNKHLPNYTRHSDSATPMQPQPCTSARRRIK